MEDLFASGRIIDLILLFILAEIALLPLVLKTLNSSTRLSSLLPNIAAGAALMLAVRLSLVDSHWQWIGGALFIALIAHLLELYLRCRPRA